MDMCIHRRTQGEKDPYRFVCYLMACQASRVIYANPPFF